MPHTALSRAADEPAFWWFELSEMMRKLLLTSVTAFLDATRKPYSELVCKIMISFVFFVVFTKYAPKSDDLLDVVMATAQLCTLLTLFYALLNKVGFFEAEGIAPEVESSVLLSIQALPVLVSICCCAYASSQGSTSRVTVVLFSSLVTQQLCTQKDKKWIPRRRRPGRGSPV